MVLCSPNNMPHDKGVNSSTNSLCVSPCMVLLLPQLSDCVSLQKDTVNSYTKMYVMYSRSLVKWSLALISLICNLQFVLLLAVFNWSINNEYVCMQCHRDKLQGQLSQDSNSCEGKQHIHCSLYMMNKKILSLTFL